jgi:hypothetical protein
MFTTRKITSRKLRVVVSLTALSALFVVGQAHSAPKNPVFGPVIDESNYEGQSKCSPSPKPGVVAFQRMVLSRYPGTGPGGISRACNVGGQSEHKEGRAWDWTVSIGNAGHRRAVDGVFKWLLAEDRFGNQAARARRLGIMYMIWNKKIWSTWGGWDTYCVMKRGTCIDPEDKGARHPHTDHVHFSFTWDGAKKETTFWNPSRSYVAALAGAPSGNGYWTAGREGSVFAAGSAGYYGSKSDKRLKQPVIDMTSTPSGYGYWLVTRTGRVFAMGDAAYRGSVEDKMRVVAIAPTATGKGYWLATSSGRVLEFGDAVSYGRLEEEGAKVVDMASTPSGLGYWLFTDNGRVFAYGDAKFFGGAVDSGVKSPVAAAAANSDSGYWLATESGRVMAFGSARSQGNVDVKLDAPIVSMAATPDGEGYWLLSASGRVFAFGKARRFRGQVESRQVSLRGPSLSLDGAVLGDS